MTTFTGSNGQGKTNLVEAACYVATFASHRVAADAPLIRQGASGPSCARPIRSAGRDSLLEIEINAGRAEPGAPQPAPAPRPREVLGVLRCVLFAPEDLAVVKGDPDQRRRYLDDLLVASGPGTPGVRADYERVLRQRSALLKSAKARGGVPPGAMEVWDDKLVSTGAQLTAGRLRLIAEIEPLVAACYSAVSGTERDTDDAVPDVGRRGGGPTAVARQADGGRCTPPDPEPDPEKLAVPARGAGRSPPGRAGAWRLPGRAAPG